MALGDFVSVPQQAVAVDVRVGVGDRVQAGDPIATTSSSSALVARAEVAQMDVPELEVEQEATVTFDALAGRTIEGQVASIAAQPLEDGGDGVVRYEVIIAAEKFPARLRPAMTGSASIVVAEHRDTVIVPSAAVGGTGRAPTVQVYANGQTRERSVEVGLSSGSETEILSGVESGEQVVIGQAETEGDDEEDFFGGQGPGDGQGAPGASDEQAGDVEGGN
jgi:multidrug efflux pump subunit AcrA (membrane-fusion protein)